MSGPEKEKLWHLIKVMRIHDMITTKTKSKTKSRQRPRQRHSREKLCYCWISIPSSVSLLSLSIYFPFFLPSRHCSGRISCTSVGADSIPLSHRVVSKVLTDPPTGHWLVSCKKTYSTNESIFFTSGLFFQRLHLFPRTARNSSPHNFQWLSYCQEKPQEIIKTFSNSISSAPAWRQQGPPPGGQCYGGPAPNLRAADIWWRGPGVRCGWAANIPPGFSLSRR